MRCEIRRSSFFSLIIEGLSATVKPLMVHRYAIDAVLEFIDFRPLALIEARPIA
jgi:hypothetical protein